MSKALKPLESIFNLKECWDWLCDWVYSDLKNIGIDEDIIPPESLVKKLLVLLEQGPV